VKERTAATKAAPPRAMAKIVDTERLLVVLVALEGCTIGVSLGEIVLLEGTPDELMVEVGM
jgi:hypothetical protein